MPRLMTRPLGLIVAMSLIVGCGDDDNGNGPIDNSARFEQISDALVDAENELITSNAGMTASLEYFTPFIAGTLGLGALEKVSQASCFPVGVDGKIFHFNGTSYVADEDTGVVSSNVRFSLYELSQGGTPILSERSGYIQVTCVEGSSAQVQIVSGTVLIASVMYTQNTGAVTGGVRSADGDTEALLEGGVSIEGELELNFLLEEDDIQATYEFPLSGTGTRIAHAAIVGPYPEPDWGLSADVTVNSAEEVTSGGAYFRVEPDVLADVAACIESGTLDAPVFTAPTTECPESLGDRLSVTSTDLQNMSDAYRSLHALWDGVAGLVEANLAVLALGG